MHSSMARFWIYMMFITYALMMFIMYDIFHWIVSSTFWAQNGVSFWIAMPRVSRDTKRDEVCHTHIWCYHYSFIPHISYQILPDYCNQNKSEHCPNEVYHYCSYVCRDSHNYCEALYDLQTRANHKASIKTLLQKMPEKNFLNSFDSIQLLELHSSLIFAGNAELLPLQ